MKPWRGVDESMHDPVRIVEPGPKRLDPPLVLRFPIEPIQSPRDKIRGLDQATRLRICEEGNVGNVGQFPDSTGSTAPSVYPSLNVSLNDSSIVYDHAALVDAQDIRLSSEHLIEFVEDFFVGALLLVAVASVNYRPKQCTWILGVLTGVVPERSVCSPQDIEADSDWNLCPVAYDLLAANRPDRGLDLSRMKLEIGRVQSLWQLAAE